VGGTSCAGGTVSAWIEVVGWATNALVGRIAARVKPLTGDAAVAGRGASHRVAVGCTIRARPTISIGVVLVNSAINALVGRIAARVKPLTGDAAVAGRGASHRVAVGCTSVAATSLSPVG